MNKESLIKEANEQLLALGNLEAVEKFFMPDYIGHAEDKEYKGHAFIKQFIRILRKAIPDITILDVAVLVDAGNAVAWQRTLYGTHQADMLGIPPSNKKVKWNEMLVSRFEGDKISEEWAVSDLAAQLLLKLEPK